MTIVIGCDSFLALRNVRNGDLGHRLAGHRVLAWVDPHQYSGPMMAKPEGVELGLLEDFDARLVTDLAPLLERAYLARKCYYDPVTRWVEFKLSSYRHNRRNPLRRTASIMRAAAVLSFYWVAGGAGLAQHWRRWFAESLRRHPVIETYRERLRAVGASVVASFSPEGMREMALIEAANTLGIPTAVMIRSLDNLSAKIQHLPYADIYFVWAENTREFLLHMYPETRPEQVCIVGSPQFDHHLDPKYCLPRGEFFSLMGLNPDRPLVVYTCATPKLIEHEIHIAQHLADSVRDGRLARRAQLLVRGHPRGFGSNYRLLEQTYPGVAVYAPTMPHPYLSQEHETRVVKLIMEDEPVHLSTLAYQDVQVNVSGTMIVDSAILDKPVVCVHYDIPEDIPSGLSVRRFYRRSDIRPIVTSGGVRLARSPDECIRLINQYLDHPELDRRGRQRTREAQAGAVDGRAGERIATLLDSLSERKVRTVHLGSGFRMPPLAVRKTS